MKKLRRKLLREVAKIAKDIARDLIKALIKSAIITGINELVVIPCMRKLKEIYDRNPEMERQYGL